MEHIMECIKEVLRIRLEADIAAMQGFLELLVLRIEGILAVGTEGIALQKERMSRIAHDIIVRVLAALRYDALGNEAAIVIPEAEIRRNITRIADFLQRQHIRPEGIHIALAFILKNLPQRQPRIEQHVLTLFLRELIVMLRIVIVAENIVRHCLDIESRFLIRHRNPFGQLHKVMAVHVFLYQLRPALRAGHRQQRLILII